LVLNGEGNKDVHFLLVCFWFVILSKFVTMFQEDKGGCPVQKEGGVWLSALSTFTDWFLPSCLRIQFFLSLFSMFTAFSVCVCVCVWPLKAFLRN